MAWLFGKKKEKEKKPETPTINQNSENLSKIIEDINKKIEYEEQKAQNELRKAIAFKKQGNDKKAKECLRKKKIIEMGIEKYDKIKFNLENQQQQIQQTETTAKVFQQYKQNNQVHTHTWTDAISFALPAALHSVLQSCSLRLELRRIVTS